MKRLLLIFVFIFSSDMKSDELIISSKINAVLPEGMSVQSVKSLRLKIYS